MPVRSVLAEADVGGDIEGRVEFAEEADCGDNGTLWVVCGRAPLVLTRTGSAELGEETVGERTLLHLSGTPKRMTLWRPFLTSGPRNSSSRFTPQRACPGSEGISTCASGSSVMKMGYMNMAFVSVRFACHERASGWWYPPARTELF